MSQNIKYSATNSISGAAVQCIIRTVVAALIAFVLYISVTTIFVGAETKEIGYKILHSQDGQNFDEVYSHYYADGEDTRFKDYDGKEEYYKTPIRSQLSSKFTNIARWSSQSLAFILWCATVYSILWKVGDADGNMTELGDKPRDKFKGLKIGLLADLPIAVLYILLIITSVLKIFPSYPRIYKILTYFMFAFNDTFIKATGNGFATTFWGVFLSAIVLLPLPIVSAYAYFMGQKHIIIKEKIIYKKEDK